MEKEAPRQLKRHEEGKNGKKRKGGKKENKWKKVRGNAEIC